jgi:GNAT superfamily N-acetyltransferase
MPPLKLLIREGDIPAVVALLHRIPELADPPEGAEYERRLKSVPHLILIAYANGEPAGCKVGYERERHFYSWMGGVRPEFRRRGVARALAEWQENWAREQGYTEIHCKTRNQHKAMLIFALQNGFDIVGFQPKADPATNRILLRKVL